MWIRICRRRFPDIEKDFPQFGQGNGLSPEWTRLWISRALFLQNLIVHCVQGNGFSPRNKIGKELMLGSFQESREKINFTRLVK